MYNIFSGLIFAQTFVNPKKTTTNLSVDKLAIFFRFPTTQLVSSPTIFSIGGKFVPFI